MRRGRYLFPLSLFVILLLVEFWVVTHQLGFVNETPLAVTPSTADTTQVRKADKEDAAPVESPLMESFAYLGRVKSRESRDSKKGNGNIQPVNQQLPTGRNPVSEGEIPELTIELGSRDISTVAQRLGFLLVAATEDRILGKVVNDAFVPVSRVELSTFSTRARSADMLENYAEIRDRIAQQFEVSPSEVRLMFLVPVDLERVWVTSQRRVLNELSVPSNQVALMRGFYRSNLTVQITEVITKDGRTINIH